MSWMNIIHKAKTIRQETAPKTGNRLVPTSLLGGLPPRDVPSLNENVNRDNKIQDQIRRNIEVETKNVRDKIAEQQYLIQQEKRGERILADGTKANTRNNPAYIRARNDEIKRLDAEKGRIEAGVRQKSGLKQRQASKLARGGKNNWKDVLRTEGNKAPAQSVRQTTENVPKPMGDVALPPVEGQQPTKDPLVGFAQERGLMPQTTQNVPKPTGNVPINKPPSNLLPRDAQGNVISAKTPTKPTQNVELPNVPQQTQQEVTQEATQQASPPTPQQGQRTGPPPKKMTTAQLNQQAQQRRQQQSNNPPPPPSDAQGNPIPPKEIPNLNQQLIQQNKRMNEKYLRELGRTATTPKQRRKDAKAQTKQQKAQRRLARDRQKLEEKEAKRKAKQNPRGGGQLVPRGTGRRQNPALVPRGTGFRQNPVLRPKQTGVKIGKSDELSKSIKNILRR